MAIQTAPDTITVVCANGDTVFTLSDLVDNVLTYDITMLDGADIAASGVIRGQRTITRKPKGSGTSQVYIVKDTLKTLNALGGNPGSIVNESKLYVADAARVNLGGDTEQVAMLEAFGSLHSSDLLQTAAKSFTHFR